MKYFLSLMSIFAVAIGTSQELTINGKTYNPSNNINDGVIEVEPRGGTPPYTYKWSHQDTPLGSSKAQGLVEGITYSVRVSDAAGNTATGEFGITPESITEIFNGTMTPAVNALGSVLFWDPFDALGIYDPVAYAETSRVGVPNWTNETQGKFFLKQWLALEGQRVETGDPIAVISSERHGEMTVNAPVPGELIYRVEEGGVIYNSENTAHVVEQGAHFFAEVKYDAPIALTHPNGDPIEKPIPFIVIWLVLGATFFTIRMGFINVRGFKHALDLAKGKYDDPNAPGQVTHFQALATAVTGTVCLGDIAGVAVAISLGGAGATFWMILCGLLGMSSKFVECTLGVKYRDILPDGRVFGGPMNYLRYGLEKRNMKGFGKVLAVVF